MSKILKELGIKVDSGAKFGISFKETVKSIVGNKGAFRNFVWGTWKIRPLGASILKNV